MCIEKAFKIIEKNLDEADFEEGVASEIVEKAENILSVRFPPSYKMFLEKYGVGDIFGVEIYGIIKDPTIDASAVPNCVWITQNLRKTIGLPLQYIAIASTGYGPFYFINTIVRDKDEESPIVIWEKGKVQSVSKSFGDFLYTELKKAM